MDEKVSMKEVNRRWEVLLGRKRQSDELVRPSAVLPGRDPFDCSDCIVPSAYALVEDAVTQAVEEWQDLDDRKIPEGEAANSDGPVKKKPKWYEKHIRLPENFDFASRNPGLPDDNGGGDRVMHLDDPTKTTSYHQELWRLFESVPTRSILEETALEGLDSPEMSRVRNIWKTREENKQPTNHQFLRLRMNNRHGPLETSFIPGSEKTQGTMLFEIWRGMMPHLDRTSSPSKDRMILEFRGEQTLEDFHRALVELWEDRFWDDKVKYESSDTDVGNERSGIFIIEDTMYTYGKVDYSIPIVNWLNEKKDRGRYNLGIDSDKVRVQKMSGVRLEDIPMRLAVRYKHTHGGTLDSQVFLVDRRHGYPRQPSIARNYPIIHDMWTPSPPTASDCEACRRSVGAVVTSLDCALTDGQKTLCQSCCDMLGVPEKYRQPFEVWKMFGPRNKLLPNKAV